MLVLKVTKVHDDSQLLFSIVCKILFLLTGGNTYQPSARNSNKSWLLTDFGHLLLNAAGNFDVSPNEVVYYLEHLDTPLQLTIRIRFSQLLWQADIILSLDYTLGTLTFIHFIFDISFLN